MQSYSQGLACTFSVFDSKTAEFMMSASLHASRTPNKRGTAIGYWTSKAHYGKGLATIAAKILSAISFEFLDCDLVEIGRRCQEFALSAIQKAISTC